jgi:outer membrane protein TolC
VSLRLPAFLAIALALAGCTVGPSYVRPDVPVPSAYLEGAADSRPRSDRPWWEEVDDQALHELIRQARARSYDLRIVVARVDEARAIRGVAVARQYPPVDVVSAISRQQDSGNSLFFTEPIIYSQYRVGLESSWEVDLWGRVRREVEAATADVQAVEDLLADTMRIVIGQVATEYVEIRRSRCSAGTSRRSAGSPSSPSGSRLKASGPTPTSRAPAASCSRPRRGSRCSRAGWRRGSTASRP